MNTSSPLNRGFAYLVVILGLFAAACDQPQQPDPSATVEVHSQALAIERPEVKADRELRERKQRFDRVTSLKQKLLALSPEDLAGRESVLGELKQAHEDLIVSTSGEGGPLPGAKGTEAPVVPSAKYEALRAKMKNYDMNNPTHVAAWATLKKQELGQ